MKYIVVDIEADGPVPPIYSMVSFGAINADNLSQTFYRELRPISDEWIPEALKVSGFTREQTLEFGDPHIAMIEFNAWVREVGKGDRVEFVSDTTAFDFTFINFYFWHFLGSTPFGHSSTSIKDLYRGTQRNWRANHRRLRKTRHTHHALDDALGNAEAFNEVRKLMRLDKVR